MSLNPLLHKLYVSKDLLELVKAGFIDYSIHRNCEVYYYYDCRRKVGVRYNQALRETADKFDISDGYVKKIIKKYKA